MSTSRIETFDAHPASVFDALLGVAEELDLRYHVVDQRRFEVVITREAKNWSLSASVTDNGRGESALHMSWRPQRSSAGGKAAKRLAKRTRRTLERMTPPD